MRLLAIVGLSSYRVAKQGSEPSPIWAGVVGKLEDFSDLVSASDAYLEDSHPDHVSDLSSVLADWVYPATQASFFSQEYPFVFDLVVDLFEPTFG